MLTHYFSPCDGRDVCRFDLYVVSCHNDVVRGVSR